MTLVVFQKEAGRSYLVGDMKINHDPNQPIPANIESWRVKVIIIGVKGCVAFAGKLHFAEKALKEIWKEYKDLSFWQMQKILFFNHCLSENETDFIVCDNNGHASKISDYKIKDISTSTIEYIGDETLFNKYLTSKVELPHVEDTQRLFLRIFRLGDEDEKDDNSLLSKMYSRMLNVSELYGDLNLGHVLTCVSNKVGGQFRYHLNLLIDTPLKPPKIQNVWETLDLGSLAKGSYSYQILSTNENGFPIVIYENLFTAQKYFFGDFSEGIPKLNQTQLRTPA